MSLRNDYHGPDWWLRLWPRIRFRKHGCWIWVGPVSERDGYGTIKVEGRMRAVHRFVYEMHRGPIPEGLTIDHLCGEQLCVNPSHMEAVARNTRRPKPKRCPRGHPYTPENTYIDPRGAKVCRICRQGWRAASAPGTRTTSR